MSILDVLRSRMEEIAATATTAAEALDAGRVDYLEPGIARLLGAVDAVADRMADLCDRLAVGVDPQGEGQRK
jgi:hypothetical protein